MALSICPNVVVSYFVPDDALSRRKEKARSRVCGYSTGDLEEETSLLRTVGMSNANPLLAKLTMGAKEDSRICVRTGRMGYRRERSGEFPEM